MIKFRPVHLIGIFAAILLVALDFYLFFSFQDPIGPKARWFYPMLIISLNISWAHIWVDFLKEIKTQKRIEVKFVDFARDIESSVKSGISIPATIIQSARKDYSELNPFIQKLSNQIKLGIPIHKALTTFAADTNNSMIKRSIAIVIEAEASGGDIQDVLKAVTDSMENIKKLKEERKSATYGQIVQGYIVYFVFIGIMLILQLKLFPQLSTVGGGDMSFISGAVAGGSITDLDTIFFMLILIQGFFAGIMIGKFSEGTIKQGLIHSLILCTMGALIITTAKGGI
ncbi:MAG: type II secretion system F family protein [Nanoarchaeota archaeon]|nr:type II secretion system F family protein [Nanoarchaeota archaeon]MBU4242311.1 type II secretion system F family protein [Nanoarchaeota archaeon]MBU4351637.1 type II secretion system F family protein [Nanoarchaeota archaeon]MBU4456865.1 type II secretion system F family protein [Nanoarchaeota archaeon]MCG2719901.1 type II secretion system F family protein [Nanoarchaeota archaeon]